MALVYSVAAAVYQYAVYHRLESGINSGIRCFYQMLHYYEVVLMTIIPQAKKRVYVLSLHER